MRQMPEKASDHDVVDLLGDVLNPEEICALAQNDSRIKQEENTIDTVEQQQLVSLEEQERLAVLALWSPSF